MFTYAFSLRTDKRSKKTGKCPLYVRLYKNGRHHKWVHTRHWIFQDNWVANTQSTIEIDPDFNKIKNQLEQLAGSGGDMLESYAPNKPPGKRALLLEVYRDHNKLIEDSIGREYSKSTHKKYQTTYKHMKAFISSRGLKDFPLDRVDTVFLNQFIEYLQGKGLSVNTRYKYMTHVRKIVYYAIKQGLMNENPFIRFRFRHVEKTPVFLSLKELQAVETLTTTGRLEKVRKLFLFACYTGLSFSDLTSLTHDEIHTDGDEDYYIFGQRTKTSQPYMIPLSQKALELIDWQGPVPLEGLSNQKMNAYLKEIADLCGISKNLTSHVARHTFATSALTKGVSMETVQKILGHRRLASTAIYAQVTPVKIKGELRRAGLL